MGFGSWCDSDSGLPSSCCFARCCISACRPTHRPLLLPATDGPSPLLHPSVLQLRVDAYERDGCTAGVPGCRGAEDRRAVATVIHRGYVPDSADNSHDLALVFLDRASSRTPLRLPSGGGRWGASGAGACAEGLAAFATRRQVTCTTPRPPPPCRPSACSHGGGAGPRRDAGRAGVGRAVGGRPLCVGAAGGGSRHD